MDPRWRRWGTAESVSRSAAFAVVGVAGFLVQLASLETFTTGLGIDLVPASAGAVEMAILHNFLWHERWTWADRVAMDPAGRWRRLRLFHLSNGFLSIAGNVLITTSIVTITGAPVLLANTLAVGACTVMNFAAADRLVFGRAQEVKG